MRVIFALLIFPGLALSLKYTEMVRQSTFGFLTHQTTLFLLVKYVRVPNQYSTSFIHIIPQEPEDHRYDSMVLRGLGTMHMEKGRVKEAWIKVAKELEDRNLEQDSMNATNSMLDVRLPSCCLCTVRLPMNGQEHGP